MPKIIIFDSDIIGSIDQIVLSKIISHNENPLITSSDASFEENINKYRFWDSVVINFQTRYFLKMKDEVLQDYLSKIKRFQKNNCNFIGITNTLDQKTILINAGFVVSSKRYNTKHLFDMLQLQAPTLLVEDIKKVVADSYGITVDELIKKTRKREIVEPRQIAMYFCKLFKKTLQKSLMEISKSFNNKDHTTILHSFRKIVDLMDTEPLLKKRISEMEEKIQIL